MDGVTLHHADSWLTLYGGDCRDVLATLPAESVHCVVTSPPYWGLRDYGTATWLGGDEGCDHRSPTMREGRNEDRAKLAGSEATNAAQLLLAHRTGCGKCGAVKVDSQLGLERTPEEYVANLVAVFREVRRVLRSDGTLWLVLGDSYASGEVGRVDNGKTPTSGPAMTGHQRPRSERRIRQQTGLKPKDLVGIPWRVAFALQADGWYLRSDIIWAKPNPMPESVTDRPTKSHEYLFLLAKSARYYFDADAVREAPSPYSTPQARRDLLPSAQAGIVVRDGRQNGPGNRLGNGSAVNENGRNIRSVWTIPTQPYPGAHFAVFPPKLVEPCIKAGCPELGTVMDCFAGSGTVGMVAQRLSRRAVLIDLNPEYLKQQLERNAALPLGLTG